VPAEPSLKLRAEDAEDLAVISTCLQDSLVSVRDLAYDRENRTFMFVANRFRWETPPNPDGNGAEFERVLCGVLFEAVDGVAYRGFRRSEEDRILSLLAIRADLGDNAIDFDFAAGAAIRLTAAAIRCHARDLGEPWPTPWRPDHPDTLP
jgi:hypothetical protein